jgi:flavin-dependent dehydrogenase
MGAVQKTPAFIEAADEQPSVAYLFHLGTTARDNRASLQQSDLIGGKHNLDKDRFVRSFVHQPETAEPGMRLADGSKVGVIGGGPAGSFFSYFLLEMAARMNLDIQVDIYEPRDFSRPAPHGCNMCGGIISESLVQYLAAEGINLPTTVVQRGIDSYMMHMDVGDRSIATPGQEKRIAAVHRGGGPRTIRECKWDSFDGYLLGLAVEMGAQVVPRRVRGVDWKNGRPQVDAPGGDPMTYDLLVVAVGVNTFALNLFKDASFNYQPPGITKTAIREYYVGMDTISQYMGYSMHVFLLDLPRLEFAALIPKGDYVTVCLLGKSIDHELLKEFLNTQQVKSCFPPDWNWEDFACNCMPRINNRGVTHPYGDRVVFIGDCGVSRLYKDGIGAAYRTAKAAAKTALFHGISAEDFASQFMPACKAIENDNQIGKLIFIVVRLIQRFRFFQRGVLRMVSNEQQQDYRQQRMSAVLWDTFTGSAPYGEVLLRTLHPAFLSGFLWNVIRSIGR